MDGMPLGTPVGDDAQSPTFAFRKHPGPPAEKPIADTPIVRARKHVKAMKKPDFRLMNDPPPLVPECKEDELGNATDEGSFSEERSSLLPSLGTLGASGSLSESDGDRSTMVNGNQIALPSISLTQKHRDGPSHVDPGTVVDADKGRDERKSDASATTARLIIAVSSSSESNHRTFFQDGACDDVSGNDDDNDNSHGASNVGGGSDSDSNIVECRADSATSIASSGSINANGTNNVLKSSSTAQELHTSQTGRHFQDLSKRDEGAMLDPRRTLTKGSSGKKLGMAPGPNAIRRSFVVSIPSHLQGLNQPRATSSPEDESADGKGVAGDGDDDDDLSLSQHELFEGQASPLAPTNSHKNPWLSAVLKAKRGQK